jgi:hypothetical protein
VVVGKPGDVDWLNEIIMRPDHRKSRRSVGGRVDALDVDGCQHSYRGGVQRAGRSLVSRRQLWLSLIPVHDPAKSAGTSEELPKSAPAP